MLKLLKKTGIIEDFSSEKIKKFLKKVNKELLDKDQISEQEISLVISEFEEEHNNETQVTQENLENFIENFFIGRGKSVFAKQYLTLRYQKAFENERSALDESILSLVENKNEEVGKENSNKDSRIAPTQRDLVAGEISKDISRRLLIPKDVMKAHDDGVIHMHDLDYFIQHIHNCELIDIKEVFENGTVMNGKMIETPKSFQVACTVLTQIIASVASSTYGGQTVNIKHLGKYLFLTKQKYFKKMKEEFGNSLDDEQIEKIVKSRVKDELTSGIQTMQYQINTLQTSNGQSAFVTLFLELDKNDPYINETAQIIAEIFKQRIEGIKNEKGVYVTPAFPKLVYVLDDHNNLSGGKYDYVTELAVECSAKRMYPDYISAKKMRENYEGNVFGPMGCRAFLSPYKDENGKYKFEGRFNQGVVTLNLPQIALVAEGDEEKFWEELEERLTIAYKALLVRHNRLKGTKASVAPILWQHGILARLKPEDTIDHLLINGYSTLSLGYIGVYEATYLMKGVSHTNPKGEAFALRLMNTLRQHCDDWKRQTGIGFALYGTPAESLCYRFARIDKKKFGKITNITDKGYYTNSYHVDVREEIDAFAKLEFESQFQKISSGGCISYIEIPNMRNNLGALRDMVKYIYDNIQYAEFNTKTDVCNACGFEGEIELNEKMEWECPQCHNKDQTTMNVVRRTCFTKENLVLTDSGYKSIADIEIGDKVLTKENRYMPVVDHFAEEDKKILKIKAGCIDYIECTPDHPFLVRTLKKERVNGRKDKKNELSKPYFKEAGDLNKNDYILSPIENREKDINHSTLPVDKNEFWWVMGRIIADGWVSKPYRKNGSKTMVYNTWICCGKHETNIVQEKLNQLGDLFGVVQICNTTNKWRSYNKDLYDFVKDIGFGASNKIIPNSWIELPKEKLENLLNGLISGDGHIRKDGLHILRSVSRKLIYSVQRVVAKLYGVHANVYKIKDSGQENILGRLCNSLSKYDIKWFKCKKSGQKSFILDGFILTPVKDVIEIGNDTVYSITVLEDASYTVQNQIVKNCGYLGENYWNDGKTREIGQRVLHLGGNSLLQK